MRVLPAVAAACARPGGRVLRPAAHTRVTRRTGQDPARLGSLSAHRPWPHGITQAAGSTPPPPPRGLERGRGAGDLDSGAAREGEPWIGRGGYWPVCPFIAGAAFASMGPFTFLALMVAPVMFVWATSASFLSNWKPGSLSGVWHWRQV